MELKRRNNWAYENQQSKVGGISLIDGCGSLRWERFMEKGVFSLEWKSEGVTNDESGDGEGDESEEKWLVRGGQSETGSLFQRWAICDFQGGAGWRASKGDNRGSAHWAYSEEVGERLSYKLAVFMLVRGLYVRQNSL